MDAVGADLVDGQVAGYTPFEAHDGRCQNEYEREALDCPRSQHVLFGRDKTTYCL